MILDLILYAECAHYKLIAMTEKNSTNKELQELPEKMRQLLNRDGYFEFYQQLLKSCRKRSEAYEILEENYQKITGKRRYSEFDSFKHVYNKWLRRQKKL